VNIRITCLLAASAAALALSTTPAFAADVPAGMSPTGMSPTDVRLYLPTTLPDGVQFDHGTFIRSGKVLDLPADLTVRGEGIYNGKSEVFKVTGDKHDKVTGDVIVDTASAKAVECRGGTFQFAPVDTANWLGNIINGAFNAALSAVNSAEGIAQAAVGASHTPGAAC
jgi:hypothetical protein